jgi:uncharacterized membrane protein
MHDINRSGWNFLIPFYNIILTFYAGSKGQNDYGLDPAPTKRIEYFDELDDFRLSNSSVINSKNPNNDKKITHQNTENEVKIPFSNATDYNYKSNQKQNPRKKIFKLKLNVKHALLFSVPILIITLIYYLKIYEPNHRDSDNDGIADVSDACPNVFGLSNKDILGCPDSDKDGLADGVDECPNETGNDSTGCYYFKRVRFINSTSKKVNLCVTMKYENDWITNGWYYVYPSDDFTLQLPKHFKDPKIYWFAENDEGKEWCDNKNFNYISKGNYLEFTIKNGSFAKYNGGIGIRKGFREFTLTDETSTIEISDNK